MNIDWNVNTNMIGCAQGDTLSNVIACHHADAFPYFCNISFDVQELERQLCVESFLKFLKRTESRYKDSTQKRSAPVPRGVEWGLMLSH